MIIERPHYLNKLIEKTGNSLVKVITGLRRSGKSFLLFTLFKNYLLSKGISLDHIIEIKFDDEVNSSLLNKKALLKYINRRLIDKKHYYILLDEIQNVKKFEPVVIQLMRIENVDVYITGSNSKFLSTDIDTALNGKNDPIHVYPLSFEEFSSVYNDKYQALNDYLTYGGLPYACTLKDESEKKQYLIRTYSEIYIKDVISRYRIDFPEQFSQVTKVLASSLGSLTNINNIVNTIQSINKTSISYKTVSNYLLHLQDAFILSKSERYDVKGRKYIGSNAKYYFEDNGVRNAILNFKLKDKSHLFENIIYGQLVRKGFNVFVGSVPVKEIDPKTKKYANKQLEIDFVAQFADKTYLIQACTSIEDKEVFKRECKSLLKCKLNYPKIIITMDIYQPSYTNEDGITIMNIYDFMKTNL